jgi:hypothetical protein
MKQNIKFIAIMVLIIAILTWIVGETEEFTDTEPAACIVETYGATEDTGCGSKYFPSE